MSDSPGSRRDWIIPLLTQLDLVEQQVEVVDSISFWTQLENSHLSERIGKMTADINEAAGYHVLEMLDFLPPQQTALRVTFTKRSFRHHMELVLQQGGIYVVFSTSKQGRARLDRYFPSLASNGRRTVVWEGIVHPGETPEKEIQRWLSYLLSGFDASFAPEIARKASVSSETGLRGTLREGASLTR